MIRIPRLIGWDEIDMLTHVPYEYKSVGEVLNSLIYLILSSTTRVDAVWRAPRPFKEGLKFLQDPLSPAPLGSYSLSRRM